MAVLGEIGEYKMITKRLKARLSYEVSENILAASTAERPLIRENVDIDGIISPEEDADLRELYTENGVLDAASYNKVCENTRRQKGEHYTQLLSADDLGISIAMPDLTAANALELYAANVKTATDALPRKALKTLFSASITELLAGTQYSHGIDEKGQPVAITGVHTDEREYTTRYRVLSGYVDTAENMQKMRSALVNGLLSDIADGSAIIGRNATEEKAYVRYLELLAK